MRNSSWVGVAGALSVAALGLTGCSQKVSADEPSQTAAKIQHIAGTNRSIVTLSPEAIARLGLTTEGVKTAPAGDVGTISYSALLYDAAGATWVYTSTAPHSFARAAVVVDRVDGDRAYLKSGPKVGAIVVTVGVPELFGAELGVGGE